jgi:hypothetical protein
MDNLRTNRIDLDFLDEIQMLAENRAAQLQREAKIKGKQ